MKPRHIRLAVATTLASLGPLILAPAPAMADETATGSGSVGSAYAFSEVPPFDVDIGPLAACTIGGAATASTPGAQARNFVTYGSGNSACTADTAGQAKIEVSGRRFRLDGLRHYGGPVIKVGSFSLSCTTSDTGSQSTMKMTGVSGIPLPNPIPPNHVVTIPGAAPTDPPVARVVLNELTSPDPPDGSMSVNLMRVQLFPDGFAVANGEIVVATVQCSPRG